MPHVVVGFRFRKSGWQSNGESVHYSLELASPHARSARRIEKRQREGKAEESRRKVTGQMLVQVYKQRVREQKALIAKAELTRERLLLITSVMRRLVNDENFVTLLRAESISDMPKQLRDRLD